jgi:hypothetical protein
LRLNVSVKHGANRAEQVTAERLVNLYTEQTDGKSQVVLHGSHGLKLFATCGSGPIRGMLRHNANLYVVSGSELYRVSQSGGVVLIGTVPLSTRQAGMATNGTYLCVVSGQQGFLCDGTTLTQITDTDFGLAETVASLNGYFAFSDGTNAFFINTTPFNGENYDALDFASAEGNPDIIRRIFADHKELLLFGELTVEQWVGSTSSFAFESIKGALTEKGLAAPFAIDQIDNTVFWLDHNGVARRMQDGYNAQRISTHSVEQAFGTLSTAEGFAYVEQGHEFFALRFDNGTWIYDAANGLWHERASWNQDTWRVRTQEYVYDKNIVGDAHNGNLYELDEDIFTENGTKLVAEMIFPPINMDGERFKLAEVQLDLEQGEAGESVRLWWSNDGLTWTSAGDRSIGAVGDRRARTIWRGLGQHRNLHLRFSISGNVRRAVFAAYATLTQ